MGFDYEEAQRTERGHGDQSLGGMVWGSVLLVGLSLPALVVSFLLGLSRLQFLFVELGLLALMFVLYPWAGRFARELHGWIERNEDAVDRELARRARPDESDER